MADAVHATMDRAVVEGTNSILRLVAEDLDIITGRDQDFPHLLPAERALITGVSLILEDLAAGLRERGVTRGINR